jgi:hypothetical protein
MNPNQIHFDILEEFLSKLLRFGVRMQINLPTENSITITVNMCIREKKWQ